MYLPIENVGLAVMRIVLLTTALVGFFRKHGK